jgi:hypothetical protein
LHKIFFNFLNKSKGFQRALRENKSLIIRVNINGYRSILNASNAGKKTKTFLSSLNRFKGSQRVLCESERFIVRVNGYRSILNAYDTGKKVI